MAHNTGTAGTDAQATNKSSRSTKQYKDLDLFFGRDTMGNDVNKVEDIQAVKRSVRNLVLLNQYEKPFQPEIFSGVREMLFENASYDLVINDMGIDWAFDEDRGVDGVYENASRIIDLHSSTGKALAVIIRSANADEPWRQKAVNGIRKQFADRGIATFDTLGRAASTVRKLMDYQGADA